MTPCLKYSCCCLVLLQASIFLLSIIVSKKILVVLLEASAICETGCILEVLNIHIFLLRAGLIHLVAALV